MSNSLLSARNFLVNKMGEYGRIKFVWLMQKYNLGVSDELPEKMRLEVYGR